MFKVAFNGTEYRIYAESAELSILHILCFDGHLFKKEDAEVIVEYMNAQLNAQITKKS